MKLAELRQARGLSQKELGEMVGRNASTIQRAEAMDKTAKLLTYRLCAEALGVSLSDLFTDDRTPLEQWVIELFRASAKEQQEKLARLLEATAQVETAPPPRSAEQGE